jgi:predicted DCC family thiol-disulfide oxidoreductase YuxK
VLLFDGVCTLCNGFVRFVIDRDPAGRFQFAPLQSDAARRVLGAAPQPLPDSLVLVENGRLFTRSTAALRVARGLRSPWPLAYLLVAVPRPVRDWVYDAVARNRYRWFGRRDVCMVPTPDLRARFLDDSAAR